jgi:hypothetical protein
VAKHAVLGSGEFVLPFGNFDVTLLYLLTMLWKQQAI